MKKILLTQGMFSLVDDEDYARVLKLKWQLLRTKHTCYAVHGVRENGKVRLILMHRFILGITDRKSDVDHVNFDGLDNRRCNLRPCSRAQNRWHSNPRKSKKYSNYKGVTGHKGKYAVHIVKNGESTFIGGITSEEKAARIYNELAEQRHRDFAFLNNV
jgi:hypothetical protein